MAAGSGGAVPPGRRRFYAGQQAGLIGFATHIFRLWLPDEKGVSLGDHLRGLLGRAKSEARRAEIQDQLTPPPLPGGVAHLWHWFIELDAARGSNGFGPSPISYPDIQAWAALTQRCPAPWEINIIKRLDALRLNPEAAGKEERDVG